MRTLALLWGKLFFLFFQGFSLAGTVRRSLRPGRQPGSFTVRSFRGDRPGRKEGLGHRLGPSHWPRESCTHHRGRFPVSFQAPVFAGLRNNKCPATATKTFLHPPLPSPSSKYSSFPSHLLVPNFQDTSAPQYFLGRLQISLHPPPFPPPSVSFFLPSLCSSCLSLLPSQQICILPTSLFGAVRRLSFSPDGSMLCGIGADRDNSLCVWSSASGDWADGARVAIGQGPRRAAMFVAWAAGRTKGSSPYQVLCALLLRINAMTLRVENNVRRFRMIPSTRLRFDLRVGRSLRVNTV